MRTNIVKFQPIRNNTKNIFSYKKINCWVNNTHADDNSVDRSTPGC